MTETKTDPAEELTTEVRRYVGRRMWSNDKLRYCWLHEDGQEWGNPKQSVPGAAIGARYRFTQVPGKDGSSVYIGGEHRPRMLTDPDPDPPGMDVVAAWELADQAAAIERDVLAKERKHAEEIKGLAEVLLPVKALLYSSPSRRHRSAVIAAVLAELERW